MSRTIITGYYAQQDGAREALRALAHKGFKAAVLIHKGAEGFTQTVDPFLRRLVIRSGFVALLCGAFGTGIFFFLQWLHVLPNWDISIFAGVVLICATVGGLTVLTLFRRERFGVARPVLNNQLRLLVSGEFVLIVNVSADVLPVAMAILRESGDTSPALFVLHTKRERRLEARTQNEKFSHTQIQEHARRHAGEQQVDKHPSPNTGLLKRIKQTRKWLRQVCVDLSAASRLEQKATPAADWILDNEYILEENVRDVLLNLPRKFFQQLPSLASDPYRGLPCIYGLAKNLVSHVDLYLDRDNILAFLKSHQAVRTLTIGELWAIPQMLRIALIESIQSLAVTALADLRDRQLADFWANRLITANRRDSNQLFAFLSELTLAETKPSPNFGVQLIGLLYNVAAALSPVQNWLERTLKTPFNELSQRELNRQTRDQLTCRNAFTSLRQLALLNWREIFEKLSRVEQILRTDPSGIYANMDFATRDRCRRAIEAIALDAGRPEEEIAGRVIGLAKQAGDPLALHVVLMLSNLFALESLAVEIATQHESTIILDLVPVDAEEGMLGLEITDLQDAIDLGMEAGPTAGKRQFCFGQRQVLQSLSIVEIRQAVQGFLLGIRQYGQTLTFGAHCDDVPRGPAQPTRASVSIKVVRLTPKLRRHVLGEGTKGYPFLPQSVHNGNQMGQ